MLDTLRDQISKNIADKDGSLSNEEQNLLKGEYKLARLRLVSQRIMVLFFLLFELIFFAYIAYRMTMAFNEAGLINGTPNKEHVAILTLDEAITDKYADKFISKMIEITKNEDVKAIIIKLRSPGGTPVASWNIADTFSSLQKEFLNKKPIYLYVDSMAASGSYMIASQSNYIYANRFAVVGSIGVIMEHMVFEGLAKKIGIGEETLTAGEYKKVFSTLSYMKPEQKERVQKEVLDVMYEGFLKVVERGRKLDRKTLNEYAEGRIFIAQDKRVEGILVDKVIDWTKFKKLVIEKTNLEDNILFNRYSLKKQKSLTQSLIGSSLDLNLNIENLKSNSTIGMIK